ncbi:MAG TPA: UDP-N-acetylglucosamine 1-carboxyvinyltransferase [Tepidiformaceae bacterium]|nr:UDP-N-acetylglucosamine 1-carboxyvinyltransferase [Tepidiformaceae bacterium]
MTYRSPRYIVQGGAVLRGTVRVSGAKNLAVAAMCAALLTADPITLTNVPHIRDTRKLAEMLETLGASVSHNDGGELRVNASGVNSTEPPADLVSTNRASFQVIGPLLARFGRAASVLPGGDLIGQRPIDVHLAGFVALGATVEREGELYIVEAPGGPGTLRGARIFLDYPSVSGTQNVMMAAVLAHGHSTLVNAATEPEVQHLAHLLNAMGARITGIGTQVIEIDGVPALGPANYRVMPDRIEAGTYAIATAMTGGEVELLDTPAAFMDAPLAKLREAGVDIEEGEGYIRVSRPGPLRPIDFQALPYPGLATDLQAPMAAMLTQAEGISSVHERVFDNRMLYTGELRKMGAEIVDVGNSAIIRGPSPLHGAQVHALDVRAGAAVLLGALVAAGTTTIEDIYHLDRGYENLTGKLRGLGVELERN